jgi:hypothetical protein
VYEDLGAIVGQAPLTLAEWGSGSKPYEIGSAIFFGMEGLTAHKNQGWVQDVRGMVSGIVGRLMLGRIGAVPSGRLIAGLEFAGGSALLNTGVGNQNTIGGIASMGLLGFAAGKSLEAAAPELTNKSGLTADYLPANLDAALQDMKSNNQELYAKMTQTIATQAVNAGMGNMVQANIKHPLILTHFSPQADLKTISPDFAETNPFQNGAERGVYNSKFSHFYGANPNDIRMETGLGANRYEGVIDRDSIFDASKPEDAQIRDQYYASLGEMPSQMKSVSFINALKGITNPRTGLGYSGFKGAGGTVGMFEDVPVRKVPFSPLVTKSSEAVEHGLYGLREHGGFTYNVARGENYAGRDAYSVGIFPERGLVLDHAPSAAELSNYIDANRDLLQDPRTTVGGWHDSGVEDGKQVRPDAYHLDVSVPVRSGTEARRLGAKYNQISVYHLGTGKEVLTGGTGEKMAGAVPLEHRLDLEQVPNEAPPIDVIHKIGESGQTFLTEAAKKKAIISFLRQRYAQAQQQSLLGLQLQTAAETLNQFSEEELADMNEQYVKTGKVDNPLAQTAYNQYAHAMDEQRKFERRIGGITYEMHQYYLPGMYESGPGIEVGGAPSGLGSSAPAFTKQKVFLSPADAIEAGYVPITHNIAVLGQSRVVYGSIAAARIASIKDAVTAGVAVESGEEAPFGWKPIIVGGRRYMVDPKMEKFFNRLYSGARFNPAEYTEAENRRIEIGKAAFKYTMKVKAATTYSVMSLSSFHALHVLHIDTMQSLANAMEQASREGKVADLGSFVAKPTSNALIGRSILDGWMPYDQMDENQKIVSDAFSLMGISPGRPTLYNPKRVSMTVESALDNTFSGLPKATTGVLGKAHVAAGMIRDAISAMQAPLFEQLIPSLKAHAALAGFWSMIKSDPTLLDPGPENVQRLRAAATDLGSQIDLRYGELQYNRYLWNPMLKNVAFLSFLSVGWNVGFIHEFIGGMGDVAESLASKAIRDPKAYPMTNRAFYAMSYLTTAAILTGSMSYLLTGNTPTLKGLFYVNTPPTPEYPDGQYESTMFFNREFSGMYYHVRSSGIIGGASEEFLDKMAPIWQPTHEIMENRDYFGNQIYDPDADFATQLLQVSKHAGLALLPISFGPFEKGNARPGTVAESMMGFNPAAGYVEHSDVYQDIINKFSLTHGGETTPYSQIATKGARRDVKEAYDHFGIDSPQFREAFLQLYRLDPSVNQETLLKDLTAPEGATMFKQLAPQQQADLFRKYGVEMMPYIGWLSPQAIPLALPYIEKAEKELQSKQAVKSGAQP